MGQQMAKGDPDLIRSLASEGLGASAIAGRLGCTAANIRILAKRHGIALPKQRLGRPRVLPDSPDLEADRARQNAYSKASYHRVRQSETRAEAWLRKRREAILRSEAEARMKSQKETQREKVNEESADDGPVLDTDFDFFS